MPKIFLAACSHIKTPVLSTGIKPHYILESFIDLRRGTKARDKYMMWCLTADEFLLDSGAYAFMNKAKSTDSFDDGKIDQYIEEYISFINKYDIKLFFEMDLDCIYPYDHVKEIRHRIESGTNKKCIPVWHISRGINEFHEMCKEYNYVAIGGIASKEIKPKDHHILWELCNIAHSYGCEIHGLGYLPINILNSDECPFDTVDGTGWQGHMRGKKFILEDEKIARVDDSDLVNKNRTWKDNESEGFTNWTLFSRMKG